MPKRSRTPGVYLLKRVRAGCVTYYGRVRDPITGEMTDTNLTAAGHKTEQSRSHWARVQSERIAEQKRLASYGVVALTIEEAVARYLAECARLRPRTQRVYRLRLTDFNRWLRAAGRRNVAEIRATDLWTYRADLLKRQHGGHALRGSTVSLYLTQLAAALQWWRRAQMLPQITSDEIADACRGLSVPRPKARPLSLVEIRTLWDASLADSAGLLVRLVLLTGMRLGEGESLLWSEVDESIPEIRLAHGEADPRTKTHTARTIDLSVCPGLVVELASLRSAGEAAGPCVTGGGEPLSRWSSVLIRDRLQVLPGRRWTWPMLRSTCGTYLACAPGIWGGASAYRAARQLGHSVAVSERHYLGLVRIDASATTIEQAMGLALPAGAGQLA